VLDVIGMTMGMNLELPAGDALTCAARKVQVDRLAKTQRGNRGMKNAFCDTEIPECSNRHVTADSREAVQIESAHIFKEELGPLRDE
jgi:hypothetical protein